MEARLIIAHNRNVSAFIASQPPVTCYATPEHLPAFWDQSVVFFANLLALFYGNEEETAALSQENGKAYRLDARSSTYPQYRQPTDRAATLFPVLSQSPRIPGRCHDSGAHQERLRFFVGHAYRH